MNVYSVSPTVGTGEGKAASAAWLAAMNGSGYPPRTGWRLTRSVERSAGGRSGRGGWSEKLR
jgi:hypothetical protein